METIYDLIKEHSTGKGEGTMWESTRIISDAIDESMPEKAKKKLYSDLFGLLSDGHYDEHFAKDAVRCMYYLDDSGEKHYAPYLTDGRVEELYKGVKDQMPEAYNLWDFYVVLHMVASDYHNLIMVWYPDSTSDERIERYVELAVNWLHDDDWKTDDKVWKYLH